MSTADQQPSNTSTHGGETHAWPCTFFYVGAWEEGPDGAKRRAGYSCSCAHNNPAPDGWNSAPTEAEPDRIERTDAVDFNPERCPHTWTPGAGTPLGRVFAVFRAAMDAPTIKSREDILEQKLEAIAAHLDEAEAVTIREVLAQLQSYWAQA